MGAQEIVRSLWRRGVWGLVVAAALATACGELGVETALEPALTQVSLSALPATVLEFDTLALTVSVQGPTGLVLDSLKATSSNPAVVAVSANRVSRSVSLVALTPGVSEVEVTAFGSGPNLRPSAQRAAAAVTVGQLRAACSGAVLQLPRSTLWVGELLQATPAVTREGTSVALASEQYASSNPAVVEVTAAGTVRALRTGTADLTFAVTCSGTRLRTQRVEARLPVTVTNETVTVSTPRDSAKIGRTGQVNATVGNLRPGGSAGVTWVSRNPSVATVAADGTWQAVSVGRTHLVARSVAIGAAQDSVAVFVDDGCLWTTAYRIGETLSGQLAGAGPCSRTERLVLDLPSATMFEVTLTAGAGSDVTLVRDPGFNGGWPTLARAGASSLDLYSFPAGRHMLQVDNAGQSVGAFTLTTRIVDSARCLVKVVRGTTLTAAIDAQCDALAVYVVDPTPSGARTTIRVTSTAFSPQVELFAWDPSLRVVSRADGTVGVPAVVTFTTPVASAMNAVVRSRSAARGTLVLSVDP
jgi:hypothetical protein